MTQTREILQSFNETLSEADMKTIASLSEILDTSGVLEEAIMKFHLLETSRQFKLSSNSLMFSDRLQSCL